MRRAAVRCALAVACLAAAPVAGDDPATRLVAAARAQVGVTVVYDPSYRTLDYPGGDPPADRGVCTDVVVRAYRALGIDLQVEVHEDMRRAWADYPKLWGLARPDANIDHRRVPNLATFLRRRGAELPLADEPAAYLAGDLVTFRLASGAAHVGIVSDRTVSGRPLVLHNVGAGAAEEDVLFVYERTGRFRYPSRTESAVRSEPSAR